MVPIGDFQHEMLDIPFSTDQTTDIKQTNLYKIIMSQPWCINLERTTTVNKILLLKTKASLPTARKWVNLSLPNLYEQHISDKIDVTTLKNLLPRRLDKPVETAAGMTYAVKLQQRLTPLPGTANNLARFNRPPRARPHKPIVSFDEATFPPLNNNKQDTTNTTNTNTTSTMKPTEEAQPPVQQYDYHADLEKITKEIETTLKAKIETALSQMDEKFEKRLQQIEQNVELKLQQLDPIAIAQDKQAHELELLTKNMNYLMAQVANIADRLKYFTNAFTSPTLSNSAGQS